MGLYNMKDAPCERPSKPLLKDEHQGMAHLGQQQQDRACQLPHPSIFSASQDKKKKKQQQKKQKKNMPPQIMELAQRNLLSEVYSKKLAQSNLRNEFPQRHWPRKFAYRNLLRETCSVNLLKKLAQIQLAESNLHRELA